MVKLGSLLAFLLLAAISSPLFPATAEPEDIDFRLKDFLGRHWRNESVRFALSPAQLKSAQAGRALAGPDNKAVAYQIISGDAGVNPSIEFAVELKPFESRSYRFTSAAAAVSTDLRLDETGDVIRLTNSRVGIVLRKRLAPGEGPIESIRLTSSRSIGDSLLNTKQMVSSYSVEIVAQGPVYVEVLCRIKFSEDRQWDLRLRLQAYEPVILVDESFSTRDASSFVLVLSRNFAPDGLLYRHGSGGTVGQLASSKIPAHSQEPLFVLEPWLRWWERQRQGTWFGVYNDKEPALLAIGAREAAVWVDPKQKPEMRSSPQVPLTVNDGNLSWTLPLKSGARKWMIAALDKEASLEPLKGKNLQVAPLPQQYFIKHGAFPLNVVKDYILKWGGDDTGHPRLMAKESDVARWRASAINSPTPGHFAKTPVSIHDMDERIANYLRTGDRELGKHLSATAVHWLQSAVDMFLRQDFLVTLGFAPHHQRMILTGVNLADVIWSSEHVSAELRERLKAQVAFLAYTVNREDYWSPERGFGANPNMTTTVAAFQAVLGCMIPAHPLARSWVSNGMRELKYNQLDRWSDDNGGWLEAPHYALVSYDHLLGAFLAAHNAGFNDYLYDPKMKKVIQWLAKISTPPDPVSGGRRHLLPIGNTYMREPSGLFGTIAYLWKEKDPEFASEMQWMHRQHGAYPAPGVGGFFPTLAGYRTLLSDGTIPEKAPAYKSEVFPRTGVMLRHHFPSDRETQLHLIAGTNHAHYDRDSGSFTLWGKGRIVANDFGYTGHAPGDEHNMVVASGAADGGMMHVTHFAAGESVDYVRGVKDGVWERQIAFVKNPDPLGPNYFVVSDGLKAGASGTWRTWFTAQEVSLAPQGALVRGKEDVDTHVFFARPHGIMMTTEEKTRETWGLTAGKYGRVSTTQTGLIVPFKGASGITTVFYPRLKTQNPPAFTSIASGNGVRIETSAGTDYVFLGNTPFTFRDGTITFEGTVGAVHMRNGRPILWLGQPGNIAAHGHTLRKGPVSAKPHENYK